MDGFAKLLLGVIALLLFYKFVERRHKILLFKVVGVLVVAFGAWIGYLEWGERRENTERADRHSSVTVQFVRLNALEEYLASEGEGPDTLDSVTFELCNTGRDTVERVVFYPTTSAYERSSGYSLVRSRVNSYQYQSGNLETDYIFAPGQCRILTWGGGPYVLYDTVAVRVVSVSPDH